MKSSYADRHFLLRPSSPDELGLGEVKEAEVLDYSAFDGQEPKCGGGFSHEIAAARTCFPAAEAS